MKFALTVTWLSVREAELATENIVAGGTRNGGTGTADTCNVTGPIKTVFVETV